ncbi:MAG: hypothetical protein HY331_05120 [Chloroflexi bacterium]|nr:hypothetical protein [Chloroflexota bacterium]
MNSFEFVQTRKRRSLRARLTDTAVRSLSPTIGLIISGSAAAHLPREDPSTVSAAVSADYKQLAPARDTLKGDHQPDETAPVAGMPVVPAADSDADRLRRIFRSDGHRLRLNETRLKATGKLDYARRLTYLFLYAYLSEGQEEVARADLIAVLEMAALYDGNWRSWLSRCPDITSDGRLVKLLLPGQEKAREILAQVSNPDAEDKWKLGTVSQSYR